jgi:adenosylcobinamide-phosphate synthase
MTVPATLLRGAVRRRHAVGRAPAAAAAGLLWDRLLGEPPALVHPVVWFGRVMTAAERALWRDRRGAGAAHAGVGLALGAVYGRAVGSTAAVAGLAVAGRELRRVAAGIADHLAAGRLEAARDELPSLVGRDPSRLDASGASAAVIESVAENMVDAVVAPLWWAALGGAAGAGGYRAVNTMDAMVGHHSARYEHYGWAAAKLDDAANWVPARLLAGLVMIVRPRSRRAVWRAVRTDAPAHPSPNAGVAEAAFAAALGVELGGTLQYGERVEHRPRLGAGARRPEPADIAAALRLARHVEAALFTALLGAAAAGAVLERRGRRPGQRARRWR